MTRYADTFFRYWLITLVPILVLPLVELAVLRFTPQNVSTTADIWVDPPVAATASNYNQWTTPAQNEWGNLNQFLQSPSFDLAVASASPIYARMLARVRDPSATAAVDLSRNLTVATKGDNLVTISYTSKDRRLGVEVVESFLGTARDEAQFLNVQQAKLGIAFYSNELSSAQQRLALSSKRLSDYTSAHNIQPGQLLAREAMEPTLATLYEQYQGDQASVLQAQQQLTKLRAQSRAGSSLASQQSFRVIDPPTGSSSTSRTKQLMNLGIALVVGLVLGGGFVVLKTGLDRTMRIPADVPALLDLPLLGVVPYSAALAAQRAEPAPKRAAVPRGQLVETQRSN